MEDNILKIDKLTFGYDDKKPVLAIDHWQLKKGQKVFLQGDSGTGKSTLLNLIAGTMSPNAGAIEILQQNVSDLSARARDKFRANHIGFIFQQLNLIPYLSVLDNVLLGGQFVSGGRDKSLDQHAETLLSALGIAAEMWHKTASHLSVGQQQRVAIARALVAKSELIIADEPTSALDHSNRDAFLDVLFRLVESQGATLIFVSHDASLAQRFDDVFSMETLNKVLTQGADHVA